MEHPRRALVVGLGIAGISAAIGLVDAGWEVDIIERSPSRRTGGYFIGLFPTGQSAAESLGAHEHIASRTPDGVVTWELAPTGKRLPGVSFSNQPGNPASLLRGDIEEALWRTLAGRAHVRFDTVPVAIDQTRKAASVTLRTGGPSGQESVEDFDLVVGADGMRSTVRRLVFGPDEDFLKPFNAMICAFQLQRPLPGLAEHEGVVLTDTRKAFWSFPLTGTEHTVLFTYRTKEIDQQFSRPPAQVLREVFGGMYGQGYLNEALEQLENSPQALFDSVGHVKMSRWHKGRVVLVGDSAWCLTLYSGMGATASMMGGAQLARSLTEHPQSVERALASYDTALRGYMGRHRILSYLKSHLFVPKGRISIVLRRNFLRFLGGRGAEKETALQV